MLAFTPAAETANTDRDILFSYQVLLGRDPETSFVIEEALKHPTRAYFLGMAGSVEFRTSVRAALETGRRLPHEASSLGPSEAQREWLASVLVLGPAATERLAAAEDWRGFLRALIAVPGFPQGEDAPPEAAARAIEPGLVLLAIDSPKPGDRIRPGEMLAGHGWALSGADLVSVTVSFDGAALGGANHGQPRADIAKRYPHFPGADSAGFSFRLRLPEHLPPEPLLTVTATAADGGTSTRAVRLASAQDAAVAPALPPIRIGIDAAERDSESTLRVRGWAASRDGLAEVEIFLGKTRLGVAERGLARPDIARQNPHYPDAAQSGFAFVARLDPAAGDAVVRAVAIGRDGARRQAIAPVRGPEAPAASRGTEAPAESLGTGGVRQDCDEARLHPSGKLTVSGWAGAPDATPRLTFFLDGETVGEIQPDRDRPDVGARYPALRGKLGYRFETTLEAPTEGAHWLRVLAETADGRAELECQVDTDSVTAAPASDVRLEIDRPELRDGVATPARGALTLSGWAVARAGIAEIAIETDGRSLGRAYLGLRREDIGAAFPDYEGSLRSGYALVLPPGGLPPGRHDITVRARARDGAVSERRFTLPVEAGEASGPSLRQRVPEAERKQAEAICRARGAAPAFLVAIAPGDGWTGLNATLASLARQAWRRFTVRLGDTAPSLPLPGQDVTPDWVMPLRAGDALAADALLEFAVAIALDPDAALFYADEIRPGPDGSDEVFLKPDFSPELLLATNYAGLPWCARRADWDAAGLALPLSGSAHGAVLRLTETGRIVHIPSVLARAGANPPPASEDEAALAEALARRRIFGRPEPLGAPGRWRIRRALLAPGKVSIVMPTCFGRDLIRRTIASIRDNTAYPDYEIVVLDNVPETNAPAKAWLREHADRVLDMPGAFNWSRFNNLGARAAAGQFLLFLNDDVEAIAPDWLAAMLELAQEAQVGAVGARLLYPDGKVQHGGQFLSPGGHGRHAFRFADRDDPGPFGLAAVTREVASVTGACLMTRRDVFARLGGFDETHSVVNNDLDFCLRVREAGLAVLLTPHATLIHHELASREAIADTFDEARFASRWSSAFARGDPFHHPDLVKDGEHFVPDFETVRRIVSGPPGPAPDTVRNVLAVKLDHLGDFISSLPALRALKAGFPHATLHLLAPRATLALGFADGIADVCHEFQFFHERSGEGRRELERDAFLALESRMAPLGIDVAVDLRLHGDTRETLRHVGARFTAGFERGGEFPWLDLALEWEGDLSLVPKRAHVSERLLQLVAALLAACRPTPDIELGPPAEWPSAVTLPASLRGRRMIALHPGVGNPVRLWPPAHFAALIDALVADFDCGIAMIGAAEEAPIAEDVLARIAARDRVVSLVGQVRLADLPSVLRACALFIGNNSGPKHIAASLGVPAIGIHSGVIDAVEWAPMGTASAALQRRMICSPCYLEFPNDCPRSMACLTGLRPDRVLREARRLLALRPDAAAAKPRRSRQRKQ